MSIQNLSTRFSSIFKEHWALTSVLLWSGLVCVLSLTYIIIGISWWSSLIIATLFFCGIYFYLIPLLPRIPAMPWSIARRFGFAMVILTDILLAYVAWHGRTDSALQSPWSQIHLWFFGAYALVTLGLTILLWRERITHLSLAATTTHVGLFYCIALLVFRFGYAYDPLIHQAAENYVVQHGKIFPLQPFYIGQYALVAFIHFITHAPVWLVDRLLLPILAAFSLPVIGYVGLTRGWKISPRFATAATLGLLALPIAEFTFTVPHNVSVLFMLWWILLLPFALQSRGGKITLLILACAATTFHPLIGIPLLIATALALTLHRFPRRIIACMGALSIGASLLFMLGIYRLQHGETLFVTHSPLTYIDNFFYLFYFTHTVQAVRPALQLLYGFSYLFPFVIICGAIYSAIRYRITEPAVRWTLFALAGGIFIGIFFISTMISIPGIAGYEQNEFVLRLKNILPTVLLPFALSGAIFFANKSSRNTKIFFICIALFSVVSLYFTYPRTDGVTHPGWNVSYGDIEVAQSIPDLAHGAPYVVLSNQILAATGLRELGFDHRLIQNNGTDTYPYAIGMSEQIYPLTQQILYHELNGTDVHTLAQMIHGSVFVAIHDYWYRAEEIEEEARIAGSNATYQFDGITVFEFK